MAQSENQMVNGENKSQLVLSREAVLLDTRDDQRKVDRIGYYK